MRRRFLGIICLLYSGIIIYVWIFSKLKNFLAPNMQIYLKLSFFPFLLMGLILLFNKKVHYKFKLSDLILVLPLVMLILSGDGRLTLGLANNRMTSVTSEKEVNNSEVEQDDKDNEIEEDNNEYENYDFEDTYFDIIDENYIDLSEYLTYYPKGRKYAGETIRVRGFTVNSASYLPDGYFLVGKYAISCCAADAGFTGFIVKMDNNKIKNNTWYEIEGVLEKGIDKEGYNMMYIKIVNIKEIDSKDEEEYVYQCYVYDNGYCAEVTKYNLEY